MSTAIAFLSGKGGSGKTTLALSMANLLCRCDVRTLLVDCDLSTNGATYFYESQLVNQKNNEQTSPFSFNEILINCKFLKKISPLKIKSNLDFIPSISEISDQYLSEKVALDDKEQKPQPIGFVNWARNNYDVILFDCQAGYTELLPILLPMMDVNLFILEADSISGSAMRSLHLKIGHFLGHAQLYQIFNKATPEEFEIYSKIVGTFFTNIGTLLFDWKIRQAFSRSQIPDLESTSAKYSLDLCNICEIIVSEKDIHKRLECFSTQLRYQELNEERDRIRLKLYKSIDKPRLYMNLLLSINGIIALGVLVIIILNQDVLSQNLFTILLIMTSCMGGIVAMGTNAFINSTFETRKEKQELEHKLRNLDRELVKLEKSLQDNANN